MSNLLEFPCSPPSHGIDAPPYALFGVYGRDITSSLPRRIPLNLVLHFAPALRKWVLQPPDLASLPRTVAHRALLTPCVGINVEAPINPVGLCWIVIQMLHLSGRRVSKETFALHPGIKTSLAIHNAWLALELPTEGLRSLHTHLYGQLVLPSTLVGISDIDMLWENFPVDSQIIKAMSLNYVHGHVNKLYPPSLSLEIINWFHSTPERFELFQSLQDAMLEDSEPAIETITIPVKEKNKKKKKTIFSGYETFCKRIGFVVKGVAPLDAVKEVGIRERDVTRKVSSHERQERETSDFEALRRRLRRTRSDDSLRSVDTAIWDPQTPGDTADEEEKPVNDDMDGKSNYSGSNISWELATTLETIRLRREARNAKHKTCLFPTEELTTARLRHRDNQPVRRHRRSSSTDTMGKEHAVSIAGLQRRIQALKEKRNNLAQEAKKAAATTDDQDDSDEDMVFVDAEEGEDRDGESAASGAVAPQL